VSERARLRTDSALLVLLLVAGVLVVASGPGPVRGIIGLAAVLLVPGGAALTRLPVSGPAAWLGLAVVLSMAVEAVGSLALVWSGWWHPGLLAAVVGAASAVLLASDGIRVARALWTG
jgi:hypothetical protein